ncbi:hypothetical protein [Actinoplanes regularis]|uniref:hypothetical protein n=1 Tax=Actinoplanes regularis TaxID=52697 RepID=UPI0025526393|nr:hypothetical protein [Actinoplanes regularis]
MASAGWHDDAPPSAQEATRSRVWVAVIFGLLTCILLTYFGYRGYVETVAYSAYRAGTLVAQPAEVVQVEHFSAAGGYGGNGSSQEVHFRSPDGGEWKSLQQGRQAYFHLEEGRTVRLGLWHGHLVTVEGRYVRTPWSPGAVLLFVLLPLAFVLTVLQIYRLRRPKPLFEGNSSGKYVGAAALLAFGSGLVVMFIDGVPWSLAPAFAVSVLGPLAWFTVREISDRRATARG